MINLLPESYKKELRAARMNVALLRYNLLAVGAVALLLLAWATISGILTLTKINAEDTSKRNEQQASEYASTRKDAEEYRTNLETAKQILANQVDYTDVIMGITKLLPNGVVLDSINLSDKDFGNQTTIAARAKDYASVAKLKESFEKSSLFTNVFFQAVTSAPDSSSNSYPLSASISVKLNKVAQ